jgi:hypothetical protein
MERSDSHPLNEEINDEPLMKMTGGEEFIALCIFFSGGNAGGATPVPIPNTEVKSSRADGTAGVTLWESRMLPDLSGRRV